MSWNSWNKFACDVEEKLIRETAGAMVSSGMKVGRGFLESRAGSERRRFCMEGAHRIGRLLQEGNKFQPNRFRHS
jgi:hypothetical protein